MILLDTDHLSLLQARDAPVALRHRRRPTERVVGDRERLEPTACDRDRAA